MLKHFVMIFLRETNNLTQTDLANTLGIGLSEYIDLEIGEILLTEEVIKKLSLFYKVKETYFSEPSLQNELFKVKEDLIKRLFAEAAGLVNITELDGRKENEMDIDDGKNIPVELETEEPVRFNKPERLIDKVKKDSWECISEAFVILPLDDMSREINQWQEVALANDQSAYDEGQAREDLMDFCSELQLLAEAFHVLNETNKPKDAYEWEKSLPADLKEKFKKCNQPELLSPEEIANPMQVIDAFCSTFTLFYTRVELWDLLEAVITYEGGKEIYKGNLLPAYQCISCLVEVAYIINKKENRL